MGLDGGAFHLRSTARNPCGARLVDGDSDRACRARPGFSGVTCCRRPRAGPCDRFHDPPVLLPQLRGRDGVHEDRSAADGADRARHTGRDAEPSCAGGDHGRAGRHPADLAPSRPGWGEVPLRPANCLWPPVWWAVRRVCCLLSRGLAVPWGWAGNRARERHAGLRPRLPVARDCCISEAA